MPGPAQASRQHNLKDYLPAGVRTPVKAETYSSYSHPPKQKPPGGAVSPGGF